jgi:hypothetical protein
MADIDRSATPSIALSDYNGWSTPEKPSIALSDYGGWSSSFSEAAEEAAHQKAQEDFRAEERASYTVTTHGLPVDNKNQTAFDWLIGLYQNNDLPGNTLPDRTKYILDATQNGYHVHFNDKIPSGDSGFNSKFQDSGIWPDSDRQVGHFLTAVDLSITANSQPELFRPIARFIAQSAILGHEMLGDNIKITWPADIPLSVQITQVILGIRSQVLS